jgi:hypothetical protein
MVSDGFFYEFHLRRFVSLYFLIGIIERELRKRVVITLGDYAAELGYLEWQEVVPDTYENRKNISMAVEKNQGALDGIEKHLPFAFWRRLFTGEYFVTLWVPALHLVFPSLSHPLSQKAADQVGQRLFKANQIRNRIAHFDFEGAERYETEKKVLVWLINAMGGPSA